MRVSANKTKRVTLPAQLSLSHSPPGPKPPPPVFDEDSSFEQDDPSLNPPIQDQPSPRVMVPWVLTITLVIVAIGLGFLLGGLWPWPAIVHPASTSDLLKQPDAALPLDPGPWGNMEYLPMYIEPPEEYLPVDLIERADRRWRFDGVTSDQLLSLFQTADLTDAQRTELTDTTKWQVSGNTIFVSPSKDLILSLSPRARKQIYAPLTADPSDIYGMLLCSYPADKFESFFRDSGVSEQTLALIKQLSYSHGHLVFFCDIPLVLDTLQTSDEKTRLLKTLMRKSTLLLRLHVTPDSDLAALERYWIKAGWGVDLRPMMESLSKIPGGARIDVVELLPPLPSADLYTYPFPSIKPEDQHKDCRWTAMNFFRDTPDQRFTDSNLVRQTMLTDYYPVLSDPRYGDIVTLAKPDGSVIHMAVFIADNIVYTKNSANFRDPFILMTLSDMVDHFSAQIPEDQSLRIQYYRNKYY